jgi:Predicted esterase
VYIESKHNIETDMLSQLTLATQKRFHSDRHPSETSDNTSSPRSSNRTVAAPPPEGVVIPSPPKSVRKNYFPFSSSLQHHSTQTRLAATRTTSVVLVAAFFFISSFHNYHHFQVRAMSTNASANNKNLSAAASSTTTDNSAPPAAALIFLHGLGDTPAGWSSLSKQLPLMKPSLANVQYVFPPAPTIPISINGGMKMPGWFDLYDWPIAVGCQHDHDGLGKAVQTLEPFVQKLESQGIPKHRIVIGGFSQGGAVALRAVYHDGAAQTDNHHSNDHSSTAPVQSQYAACVNLSGWLTFDDQLSSKSSSSSSSSSNQNHESCNNVPLFWGHGSFDDKVLFEQQKYGVDKLVTEMNLKHVHDYSFPIGHGAHPEEMVMLAEFLDKVLFGNGGDDHETSNTS